MADEIRHVKVQSDAHKLGLIVDTFANMIEFVGDDAACFFALALLINDLTNMGRPVDPYQFFRDLNSFLLDVPCTDTMASATPDDLNALANIPIKAEMN